MQPYQTSVTSQAKALHPHSVNPTKTTHQPGGASLSNHKTPANHTVSPDNHQQKHQIHPASSKGSFNQHPHSSPSQTNNHHHSSGNQRAENSKAKSQTFGVLKNFLPASVYNCETKKLFGILSAEDLLIVALIFLLFEKDGEDNILLILALAYILLSEYINFPDFSV
jgi:hypothetical protein